jgi:citrate lyase beta subunit
VAGLSHLRSLLFAPGSDERKLAKALGSHADGAVADLEDAVAPAQKGEARSLVVRMLAESPARGARLVRVNAPGTPWFEEDLAALAELELDAVVVPKATPESVAELGASGPPLLALVETAEGLRLADKTARSTRVAALALGAADLGAELGLEPRADGLEILFAPTPAELDWASRVIEAYEAGRRDGRGAVALDGSMVDLPIVERARRLLSEAKGEVG